jgi:hypothetical protein
VGFPRLYNFISIAEIVDCKEWEKINEVAIRRKRRKLGK